MLYTLRGKIAKAHPYQLDTTLTVHGAGAEAEATGKAIDAVKKTAADHIANKENPHKVTKAQVGLGNVDNTADIDKPVSTAQSEAIREAKEAAVSIANEAVKKAEEAVETASNPGAVIAQHMEATNPHGLTAEQLGALSLSGGTMTGMLNVPYFAIKPLNDNFPGVQLYGKDGHLAGVIVSNAELNKIYLQNNCKDTEFKEAFFLPAANTGRTANGNYNILTDKSPVTIAQGGTGATTAENARKALNAVAIDMLWTNASPTSAFAAQTLELGLSNYDWYAIAYKYSTEVPGGKSCLMKCGNSSRLDGVAAYTGNEERIRSVFYEYGNLRFESAKCNGTERNTDLIPLFIIGIKGVK